jgi:hypothetical protein
MKRSSRLGSIVPTNECHCSLLLSDSIVFIGIVNEIGQKLRMPSRGVKISGFEKCFALVYVRVVAVMLMLSRVYLKGCAESHGLMIILDPLDIRKLIDRVR